LYCNYTGNSEKTATSFENYKLVVVVFYIKTIDFFNKDVFKIWQERGKWYIIQ